MDPTPRAELDAHVAQLVRMSRHVQIYSLELMVRPHFPLSLPGVLGSDPVVCLQGSPLDTMPLAFGEIVAMIAAMRANGRRRMKLIGLTRTGITSSMAHQIAQAVRFLPLHGEENEEEVLEMQQVSLRALYSDPGKAMTPGPAADDFLSRRQDPPSDCVPG